MIQYQWHSTPQFWSAVDDETYDGAPDSARRSQIGFGRTREEALDELLDILAEYDEEHDYAERQAADRDFYADLYERTKRQ